MDPNFWYFLAGFLLLMLLARLWWRWAVESCARKWYERHGYFSQPDGLWVGERASKPWYVRRFDKWEARR